MKRPKLIHFTAIQTQSKIAIRASVYFFDSSKKEDGQSSSDSPMEAPFQSLALLASHKFLIKLVGLNSKNERIFRKIYESDSYGTFDIRVPTGQVPDLQSFQVFEVSTLPGIEYLLGTRIPIKLNYPKKLIISDFDKTLVDTRYSTPAEVYESLRNPIDHFPKIQESVDKLIHFIAEGFQPFILTASPHFYENAIRDWLYQNKIYTADIFLKDYRKVLSFLESLMTPKDLKAQGFYKLNHLVDILNMTGIPDELVLMGDGFEADPLIYAIFATILENKREPWNTWNHVKRLKAFRVNSRQDSLFLNKLYQLQTELTKRKKQGATNVQIFIRRPAHIKSMKMPVAFLAQKEKQIEYYES